MINRKTIDALLTHHTVCRQRQEWPLVDFREIHELRKKVVAEKLTEIDKNDLFVVGNTYDYVSDYRDPLILLREKFSLLDRILTMSPGNVVIAGGALFKATKRNYLSSNTDLDVFFHSMPYEAGEIILRAFILGCMKEFGRRIYVTRNSMVTTMYLSPAPDLGPVGEKYQFIHRVYPNKSCIIGGFDLDCSAILYDGHQVLATPLFAFTYSRDVLISDLSRLSTSHSDRVRKYVKRGGMGRMAFTTMSNSQILERLEDSLVETEKVNLWLGGGLSAEITIRDGYEPYFGFAKRCRTRDTGEVVDYEGFDGSDFNMDMSNTMTLLRGKFDCIKWSGYTADEIFSPSSENVAYWDVADITTYFNHHGKPDTITAAVRWVPFDEIRSYKKNRNTIRQVFTPERIGKLASDAESSFRKMPKLGPKWIAPDDNPGRQFTSSFHPIDNVIGWYNPKIYKPFQIGVQPDVWATVRCAQKRRDGPLGILTRDTIRVIFGHVRTLLAEDGYKLALCL